MSLKDILMKLINENNKVLLSDGSQDWEVTELLGALSEVRLKTTAHLQPGMYIAEIDPRGYLGRILYRVKEKA